MVMPYSWEAGKVTAGLAESKDSLPPPQVVINIGCRLTVCRQVSDLSPKLDL